MDLGWRWGMSQNEFVAAVDLGGTWVRVALIDKNGKFHAKAQETVDARSAEAMSNQLVRLVHLVCTSGGVGSRRLAGVGIASAGPLDIKQGALTKPTNIPLEFVPLVDPIGDALGVSTYLVNDGTAGVLGERWFGAGRGIDNLVYVTIGTGIGGGAIVDGHVLLGKEGNAVEIGHFVIDYEGRLTCGCGQRGHWEAYCSGKNLPAYVQMRLRDMSPAVVKESLLYTWLRNDPSNLRAQNLFNVAKRGDNVALQLVEEIGVLNAMGFANVINAYDPSLITVGGAVALANKNLVLPPIRQHVSEYSLNREPKMKTTPLGTDAGVLGGAAAVLGFCTEA
jgi:glucokinase